MAAEQVVTGCKGQDTMLGGGLLPGSMALVRGAPATGKTSLALRFLMRGARQNESGRFISFDEFLESLYRDARSLGWDLRDLEEEGRSGYSEAFKGGLSFLVDVIILMPYLEIDSAIQRAILVLKMRDSVHAKEVCRYVIEAGGLQVTDVFEGRQGLLSGTAHEALG